MHTSIWMRSGNCGPCNIVSIHLAKVTISQSGWSSLWLTAVSVGFVDSFDTGAPLDKLTLFTFWKACVIFVLLGGLGMALTTVIDAAVAMSSVVRGLDSQQSQQKQTMSQTKMNQWWKIIWHQPMHQADKSKSRHKFCLHAFHHWMCIYDSLPS